MPSDPLASVRELSLTHVRRLLALAVAVLFAAGCAGARATEGTAASSSAPDSAALLQECALVARADVEMALGRPAVQIHAGADELRETIGSLVLQAPFAACVFEFSAGDEGPALVVLHYPGLLDTSSGQAYVAGQFRGSTGLPSALAALFRPVTVPDLGDGAAWSAMSSASLYSLGVRRGSDYIVVGTFDVFADEQAALNASKAIAGTVLRQVR
jgi:hypothetical protein